MASENSTNHVEPGEEVSFPLKNQHASTQRKRKPATSETPSGSGLRDLNLPPEGSNTIIPAGHVNILRKKLQESSGIQDRDEGLKKQRRSNSTVPSVEAARSQPRREQ